MQRDGDPAVYAEPITLSSGTSPPLGFLLWKIFFNVPRKSSAHWNNYHLFSGRYTISFSTNCGSQKVQFARKYSLEFPEDKILLSSPLEKVSTQTAELKTKFDFTSIPDMIKLILL